MIIIKKEPQTQTFRWCRLWKLLLSFALWKIVSYAGHQGTKTKDESSSLYCTPVSSMSPLSCEHIPFCPRLFHMNGTKSTSFSETGLTIAVILALMLKDICIFLWALLCQNSHIRSPGNESMLESAITLFANHHGNQKEKRPTALALQIYNRPQSTGFGGNQ